MYDSISDRLPKPVYFQCIWIIKDIDRLYRLDAMRRMENRDDELVLFEDENCRIASDMVISEASWKLSCIMKALDAIPEEYRTDTIESIADGGMPVRLAHENTWKKWRRVFIKELAMRLNLI